MIEFASNRHFNVFRILISILLVFGLAVSIAGNVSEGDCDDHCQEDSGACCECICCPNKVLMTAFDDADFMSESSQYLWTIQIVSLDCEQEWYVPIEHPPQNLS